MHNGSLKTLRDVVEFYDQRSSIAPLKLTNQENRRPGRVPADAVASPPTALEPPGEKQEIRPSAAGSSYVVPISGNDRQASPNPILRPAPRRQRPDHRPTAAARAVEAERAELRAWLHDRVLQHLEYLAAGGYADAPDAAALDGRRRGRGRRGAARLRRRRRGRGAARPRRRAHAGRGGRPAARRRHADPRRGRAAGGGARSARRRRAGRCDARGARQRRPSMPAPGRATVRADVAGGAVVVRIADDGAGFDPAATPFGCGLRRQRAGPPHRRRRGTATLDSSPGAGTRLTFTVPLPEPTAPEVVA